MHVYHMSSMTHWDDWMSTMILTCKLLHFKRYYDTYCMRCNGVVVHVETSLLGGDKFGPKDYYALDDSYASYKIME